MNLRLRIECEQISEGIANPFFCEKCQETIWVNTNAPGRKPLKIKCSKGHLIETID